MTWRTIDIAAAIFLALMVVSALAHIHEHRAVVEMDQLHVRPAPEARTP